MSYSNETIPQFWTKCRHCEGSGKEYFGCPDSEEVRAVDCSACDGKGGWFDEDALAAWIDSQRQAYEADRQLENDLRGM